MADRVSPTASARGPIFNAPPAVLAVIALLVAIEGARHALPPARDLDILSLGAFVPARMTMLVDASGVMAAFSRLDAHDMPIAAYFLGEGGARPWTLLTYALLHGGWSHVGFNCLWLLAFGAAVERRLGAIRFLVFLAGAALAGALTHLFVHPYGVEPMIGASAAVSGAMGAVARFGLGPGAARRSGLAMLGDRRLLIFVGVWFLTNILFGLGAQPLGLSEAPIAWEAHVGGFLVGLLGFSAFELGGHRAVGDPH